MQNEKAKFQVMLESADQELRICHVMLINPFCPISGVSPVSVYLASSALQQLCHDILLVSCVVNSVMIISKRIIYVIVLSFDIAEHYFIPTHASFV